MSLDSDELAGVCDLFGGLTREELAGAVADLAARRGDDHDRESHDRAVADAREAYALLEVDPAGLGTLDADASLLVPGPRAFPVTPEGGEDLPHLLDAPRRDVPSDAVETALRARLAADVAALDESGGDADGEDESGDEAGIEAPDPAVLIDVTYDAAALTGTDFTDVRERIADAR
ncbi:DUF7109 family protein [Halarchaeum nitratireducens]|uniref:Uncharacterized protein n=1 Tax=Halarchaeum nitratireducens TaxID=489913 RepID=A0A830GA03_9EURY|nr:MULTISPECIES: hypothetical protein [Halarchaeum]MBP2251581.1 hypothetical protein [Halarchaeum solikamskense]GGN13938.1 hypothetical protein GCM10009021_12570 [Halarchaeum nitratireducens]